MTWLSTNTASAHLGGTPTPKELARMAKAGRVPAHKNGGRWRFDATELDDWARGRQRPTGPVTSGRSRR